MAYSEKVLDHYENPRNVGVIEDDLSVGTGMVGAPACGDVMKLQIKVGDDGIIQDAKFKTYGCGSAIASSSELVEMLTFYLKLHYVATCWSSNHSSTYI